MDFVKELQQFLHKEYIREFRWEKYVEIPLKSFRQAVKADSVNAIVEKIDKNGLYDYNGAFDLAFQIHENIKIINTKGPDAELKEVFYCHDPKLLKSNIYLQKASEIFSAVVLPEQRAGLEDKDFKHIYIILRRLLPFFNRASKELLIDTWESKYPFISINEDEIAVSDFAGEYRSFLKYFRSDGVYEVMKMSQEFLGFTTLNHVLGVHALAMKIGRQLKEKGFDVDLSVLSATSINHDIGKFGCKGEELKRIAYLHYYYTKEWFDRYKMPSLSHVAMNHGTWDLENIRLPIETMVLIYSDFCVKNRKTDDGKFVMSFFPIDEAFEVIKNMLDNLDEQKLARYQTVYEKLKDLDDLLSLLGIDRNIGAVNESVDRVNYSTHYNPIDIVNGNSFGDIFSMLQPEEITLAYKNLSVASNFKVLYHLRDVKSLSRILEQARLEKNWKDLRTYLRIIEDYSDYFTHDQRIVTMDFLFELLDHDEDDIRYHSSLLIANLINTIDEEFHKELPDNVYMEVTNYKTEVFKRILSLLDYKEDDPDESAERKEQRIYNTTVMVRQLFIISSQENLKEYKKIFFEWLPDGRAKVEKSFTILYLAEIILVIFQKFTPGEMNTVLRFIQKYIHCPSTGSRLMVLNLTYQILSTKYKSFWLDGKKTLPYEILAQLGDLIKSGISAGEVEVLHSILNTIKPENRKKLPEWQNMIDRIDFIIKNHCQNYRNIFLDNFKTKTSWVVKKSNCDFLTNFVLGRYENMESPFICLETAGHFANLLKVSRVEGTRFRAGQRLVELLPDLEAHQVNELAIELLRSLEQDDEGYTQYIPRVLGEVLTFLPKAEFVEIIADISESLKSMHINNRELFIKTLGHIYKHINKSQTEVIEHKDQILSLLVNAVYDTDEHVAKAAYNVFGNLLLRVEAQVSVEEKREILYKIGKKFITQIRNRSDSIISLFYSSSCLNQIYRFISSQEKAEFHLEFPQAKKVAFVPGTYDPFTNGHRELVQLTAARGYEVYIQVDEYSWSKRTLPRLLRKHIVRMAIADLLDVYLYPFEPPLNLALDRNLEDLKERFKPKNVSLVVGTDVISDASAYRKGKDKTKISIYDFHHLIFLRPKSVAHAEKLPDYKKKMEKLNPSFSKGYEEIVLDSEISMISSSRIRESVKNGKTIDDMVDPVVSRFIQERRLYVHTPEYKSEIGKMNWRYRTISAKDFTSQDIEKIADLYKITFRQHPARSVPPLNEVIAYFITFMQRKKARILLLENVQKNHELIGFLCYFELEPVRLLTLVQSPTISQEIRERTSGPLVYSSILAVKPSYQSRNLAFELKTRAAFQWIESGFMYAISKVNISVIEKEGKFSKTERRLLELNEEMGYELLPYQNEEIIGDTKYKIAYMLVNLQRPVLMVNDLIDQFKGPYQNDKELSKIIYHNQKLLAGIFRNIYPGNFLLRINNRDLVAKVIEKICEMNEVQFKYGVQSKVKLGNHMAILLGEVLGREIVPYTVTKALHADRTIDRKGHHTFFMPYPYYSELINQLAIMKNFDRSPILADLFSLSGETLLTLIKLAADVGLSIEKVVVGIISGQARELLHANGIDTQHLIHLPRLTKWFNLRHFYPFIGGETIKQPFHYRKMIIESMNYIFPYRRAKQLKEISREHLLSLSKICLLGSYEIFNHLEDVYLKTHKRELTLMQLPEIMEDPRRPIQNPSYDVNWNVTITDILEGDIEQLERYYY